MYFEFYQAKKHSNVVFLCICKCLQPRSAVRTALAQFTPKNSDDSRLDKAFEVTRGLVTSVDISEETAYNIERSRSAVTVRTFLESNKNNIARKLRGSAFEVQQAVGKFTHAKPWEPIDVKFTSNKKRRIDIDGNVGNELDTSTP